LENLASVAAIDGAHHCTMNLVRRHDIGLPNAERLADPLVVLTHAIQVVSHAVPRVQALPGRPADPSQSSKTTVNQPLLALGKEIELIVYQISKDDALHVPSSQAG
jgi:hypothetical protein